MKKNFIKECSQYLSVFLSITLVSTFIMATPLQQKLMARYSNVIINPDIANSLDDTEQLALFYRMRDHKPLWLNEDQTFTPQVQILLKTLSEAEVEGLNSADYIHAYHAYNEAINDPSKTFEAEIVLTTTLLRYMDDIQGERLKPNQITKDIYIKTINFNAAKALHKYSQEDPTFEWLKTFTLKKPWYQILKAKLAVLRQEPLQEPWPILPKTSLLKLNQNNVHITTLQTQLLRLNYYANPPSGQFDQATLEALKKFQKAHDIEADGIAGPYTQQLLNDYDPRNRIKKLIISMERCRWLPRKMENRFIIVNIAGFELFCFNENKPILYMPVIIGQNFRKTPVFESVIQSVRFNPNWSVPMSIAVKDKLPILKKNPGYLEKGNYVLYDRAGNKVDPNNVSWKSYSPQNFPFRIVQSPGDHNALGKIRFSIVSPFGIYLHDTSNPALFKKGVRNLSSGCIRVSAPKALASFVFNDAQNWPEEKIALRMSGNKTSEEKLARPLPIYISYFTAWPKGNEDVKFMPDIYGQDELVWQALESYHHKRQLLLKAVT